MTDPNATPSAASSSLDWCLAFKGSVNRWECDENDHLNVRFYSRMAAESLANALAEQGIRVPGRVTMQHMRYLAEARLATPVSGHVACVGVAGPRLRHLIELRHSFSGIVLATVLSESRIEGHGLPDQADQVLPAHAGPRGLERDDSPFGSIRRPDAASLGFVMIGKGVISLGECDADGAFPTQSLMGRMSDAMPNLWAVLQTAEEQSARSSGFQGGAVLEYRMWHHLALRAGNRYEVWSGVREVGAKLQRFVHLMFDADSDACVMSGEAVAVVLDLRARKAIEIPAERRERMLALRVRPPAGR